MTGTMEKAWFIYADMVKNAKASRGITDEYFTPYPRLYAVDVQGGYENELDSVPVFSYGIDEDRRHIAVVEIDRFMNLSMSTPDGAEVEFVLVIDDREDDIVMRPEEQDGRFLMFREV